MKKEYYESLDGLRAIAVGIVMLAHAGSPVPRDGTVGVDIFFVMSGFLITTILSNEAEREGGINLRNFYVRRALRLIPALVALCIFVAVWIRATRGAFPVGELLLALTYTANWARAIFNTAMPTLGHCWSLAIEEQYYLVWPFVVLLLERLTRDAKVKALLLLNMATLLALYRSGLVGRVPSYRLYFALDTHMDGLVMGSGLCYVVKALNSWKEMPAFLHKILGRMLVPCALAALLVILLKITRHGDAMPQFGFFIAAASAAILVLDLVVGKASLIKAPLSLAPLVYVGRISYGLYLWHIPVYRVLDHFWKDAPLAQAIPLKLTLSLVVAAISFHLLEAPFLRLKRHFESHSPSAAKAPVAAGLPEVADSR